MLERSAYRAEIEALQRDRVALEEAVRRLELQGDEVPGPLLGCGKFRGWFGVRGGLRGGRGWLDWERSQAVAEPSGVEDVGRLQQVTCAVRGDGDEEDHQEGGQ